MEKPFENSKQKKPSLLQKYWPYKFIHVVIVGSIFFLSTTKLISIIQTKFLTVA